MTKIKGFTLIEILVVIAIIGVLAGITIPLVVKNIKKGKDEYNTSLEKELILVAKDYYSKHLEELPTEKELPSIKILWSSYLSSNNYFINNFVDADNNSCDGSYVVVRKNNDIYDYTSCLVCKNGYKTINSKCSFNSLKEVEKVNLALGSTETKELTYTYNGEEVPTCTITNANKASCDVDLENKKVSISGVEGGFTIGYLYTANETLKQINLSIYEPPTTPIITASDGKESDVWHTANTTLTYGGSRVSTGSGSPIYYSGETLENMTSNVTSITATENTNGTLYLVKACNSEYPSMCSEEEAYGLKIDKTYPTIKFERPNTSNVTISCTDSISGVALLQLWWRKPGDAYQSNYTNYRYAYGWVTPDGSMYTKNYVYFKTISAGTHYIYAKCTDNAGRVSTWDESYQGSTSGSGTTTSSQTSATITGICTCNKNGQLKKNNCASNNIRNSLNCYTFCSLDTHSIYSSSSCKES